jgi:hypothetical protein
MANKVNLDVAEKLDITCRRGDTFSLTLTLKDSSGTALELSTLGYEFLMDVKTNRKQTPEGLKRDVVASSALSKSTSKVDPKLSNGFEFTDITDSGTVKVSASADTMSSFPVGAFVYDIQQKVGDEVTTILTGSFRVKEDISN